MATAEAVSYVISVKISLLAHAWMTGHLHLQSYHHQISSCLCSIDGEARKHKLMELLKEIEAFLGFFDVRVRACGKSGYEKQYEHTL